MSPTDYIKKAKRTESNLTHDTGIPGISARIEHGIFGLVTESGELLDNFKKAKYYGKKIDKVNIIEEIGDIFWYLAIMCDELGISFEEVWEININKLKTRFPEKFDQEKAINRDYAKERVVLEGQKDKKTILEKLMKIIEELDK